MESERITAIDHALIEELLVKKPRVSNEELTQVIARAKGGKGLSMEDVATLIGAESEEQREMIFQAAGRIKKQIYGDRIVVFAPLYISDFCVNNCTYCGYRRDNKFKRRRLTMSEIQQEVVLLEKMGHKRLALEVGHDPVNCDLNYIIESIKTIYNTHSEMGAIRRINVNMAAASVEEYSRLKDAGIGTYILFQESYHKPTYESVHPKSLKSDYHYHLDAFDRAMMGGIDDVGAGVLFGLADWRFELLALLEHNRQLEARHGVGFHTISVPRIKRASGVQMEEFEHLVDDDTFMRIVAILRVALPYTGIILSTRESAELRRKMIHYGVSQISAGSCTGVGGYNEESKGGDTSQFKTEDDRKPNEVLKELLREGFIPSYCTACYRSGRTGDRFMRLARSGKIQEVCQPNALMTLAEYAMDYGDEELREVAFGAIEREIEKIENSKIKEYTIGAIEKIEEGERDLFV
ncbi:MAG: [FeFe] hydrogenase H-cluster radical SAM maturase HydG [Bacteroidales bacterium]